MNTRALNTVSRTADRLSPALWLAFAVLALGGGIAALRPAAAQEAPADVEIAAADKLAEIVGPIALYPDDLVAIVLPASTYPLQIVQAARFLEDRAGDSSLKPDPDWDDSIVALLNYPEVVKMLNDDLDWTYDLGTAVLNQRADVLNAIQSFRDQAYAAGNLRSDERQTVARDDGAIAIKSADPQVIYVPYYEPERVVVQQPAPVYYYYPRPYPVYYYPYPAHYAFGAGFWGVRSWFSIGWHTHHVHVYDWHYHSHPYYGWSYYDPFYVHNTYVNVYHNHVWQPHYRYGGRPVVRGHEGRVYTANTPPAQVNRGGASSAYRNRTSEGRTSTGTAITDPNRVSRGGTSSGYRTRTTDGAAGAAATTPNGVSRGSASSAYRNRGSTNTAPAEQAGAIAAPSARGAGRVGQANPGATPQGQRYRAAPSARALQESTGMPREASRGTAMRASPPRAIAPMSRESSGGGVSSAPRGNSSGGSYRGGEPSSRGQQSPSARGGSEGRSAAR